MSRQRDPNRQLRGKLNLTIHPEIRVYAEKLAAKRRRSISQLLEDLVEAEWLKVQAPPQAPQPPQQVLQPQYYVPQQPYYPPQPIQH